MHELESEASRQRSKAAEEFERALRVVEDRHHVTMEELERRVASKIADRAMVLLAPLVFAFVMSAFQFKFTRLCMRYVCRALSHYPE